MAPTVTLGIERLLDSDRLDGRRIGLVANPASVDADYRHVADRLAGRSGSRLVALFGPQHGFEADAQDNMVESPHRRDVRLGVPVYSLYSETREPTADMLRDLDTLVIDLQDVGTRVFTFVYTMANCMRAAAAHDVEVIVCDRPNPIGGTQVEGPVLEPAFRSFVGQFPIPLRHGMTIGELARLFNEAFGIGARLEISPMAGWQRPFYLDECGLPWIMPSPNLPTLDSAIVYPGAVLVEGTALSEGRGTTRPFELIGAPGLDSHRLVDVLDGIGLPGLRARPVWFEPMFQKHAGRRCGGCQLHVTDRTVFRPVEAAVVLLHAIREQDASRVAWREPPYEYERERMPIDILYGSSALRLALEAGSTPAEIVAAWAEPLAEFAMLRARHLLY